MSATVSPFADPDVGTLHPTLHILTGSQAGKTLPMKGLIMTIGSDPTCTLPISGDSKIFGCHARLEVRHGALWVGDVGSPTGTYVNDEPILGMVQIHHGDRVRVGNTVIAIATRAEELPKGSLADAVGSSPGYTGRTQRSVGRSVMAFSANILLVVITLVVLFALVVMLARYMGWPLPDFVEDILRTFFSFIS